MKKGKLISKIMVFALTITLFASAVYMAYNVDNSKGNTGSQQSGVSEQKVKSEKMLLTQKMQGITNTEEIDIKKQPEKELDTSKVDISDGIKDFLKGSDSKNFEKNISNYKKALVKFDIPGEFRNRMEKQIKKGKNVPDILALYNFLYDNYGTISEMEDMIDELESGKNLGDIIREYNSTHPEFVPKKFDDTYIVDLMKTMSIDDILIADRISQKGIAEFEDLITKRQSGISWKDINTSLGIICTSDKLPRMSLTHAQVNKCIEDNGVNERDATDILILAWKTGKDYSKVVGELKKGKKKEDIYAENYMEKYK